MWNSNRAQDRNQTQTGTRVENRPKIVKLKLWRHDFIAKGKFKISLLPSILEIFYGNTILLFYEENKKIYFFWFSFYFILFGIPRHKSFFVGIPNDFYWHLRFLFFVGYIPTRRVGIYATKNKDIFKGSYFL